jgi:hypothetical protein
VVFDLPDVVPLTARYVEAAGLSDRIFTVAGDYTTDVLPTGFDLVFLSAIVHSHSPEENTALLRKAAGSLDAGGRVAILDWIMTPDRIEPVRGAFFALNMLVGTRAGDTYTETEMRGWCEAAGLPRVERHETAAGTSLLIASAA